MCENLNMEYKSFQQKMATLLPRLMMPSQTKRQKYTTFSFHLTLHIFFTLQTHLIHDCLAAGSLTQIMLYQLQRKGLWLFTFNPPQCFVRAVPSSLRAWLNKHWIEKYRLKNSLPPNTNKNKHLEFRAFILPFIKPGVISFS